MITQFVNILHGQERLWKVFWIWCFALPFGVAFVLAITVYTTLSQPLGLLFNVILLIYNVFVFIGLWRCAFNCEKRFWGYIARVFTVLGLIGSAPTAMEVMNGKSSLYDKAYQARQATLGDNTPGMNTNGSEPGHD